MMQMRNKVAACASLCIWNAILKGGGRRKVMRYLVCFLHVVLWRLLFFFFHILTHTGKPKVIYSPKSTIDCQCFKSPDVIRPFSCSVICRWKFVFFFTSEGARNHRHAEGKRNSWSETSNWLGSIVRLAPLIGWRVAISPIYRVLLTVLQQKLIRCVRRTRIHLASYFRCSWGLRYRVIV